MKAACLFPGRFQPFHNGHLLVLKGMVKMCGKVVVAVGSAEKGPEAENPFTAAERREMIQRALQDADIIPAHDVDLLEVPDVQGDDAAWVRQCLALAPGLTSVWTGNAWTKRCFADAGVAVRDIKEVPGISATEIRRRMAAGEDWRSLVPEEVARYIGEIDGTTRMR